MSTRSGCKRTVFALPLLVVCLLTGCAFRTQTTGMAVDYNDFVAQTTNRQTLLNVLRAREREPMHFTSFSEVFGQVRGTGTASLGTAFNGDSSSATKTRTTVANSGPAGATIGTALTDLASDVASVGATNVTPSLGIQITTGTDFKVTANATDDFYRGILNPVPAPTIVHYLRQGFPADLLSHLLIGRLEFSAQITKPGGKVETVYLLTMNNSPDEDRSAREFEAAIRCRKLDYSMTSSPRRALPLSDLASLAPIPPDVLKRVQAMTDTKTGRVTYELVTAAQNEFGLALSEPTLSQCSQTRELLSASIDGWSKKALSGTPSRGVRSSELDPSGVSPKRGALAGVSKGSTGEPRRGSKREELGQTGEFQFQSEDYFTDKLPDGYRGDLVIDLTLRSVQGVIYYLGEYVRREATSPKLDGPPCPDTYCMPILRVLPASEVKATARFVDVTYRGRRYAVPLSGRDLTPEAGRSSQTIDLVQQLLNLNRSSKDLPSTPLLRVVN